MSLVVQGQVIHFELTMSVDLLFTTQYLMPTAPSFSPRKMRRSASLSTLGPQNSKPKPKPGPKPDSEHENVSPTMPDDGALGGGGATQ